jgi:hypothetical protein
MPKRHGNWLSENESRLVNLTLRVPPTTAKDIAELQTRTGLCKRDVIKEAVRQFVQRQRDHDPTPDAANRKPLRPDPAEYRNDPYFAKKANGPI